MENLGKHLQGGLACTENDVISHSTDLFRPVAQEVSMKDSCTVYIDPVNQITQKGPYDFPIVQRGHQYVQNNGIRLYMKFKVVTSADAAITKADGVSLCNLFGNALFQTMQIEIAAKAITDLENTHANYKAYVETLLSYSPQKGGGGPLAASAWQIDTAKHFDDTNYAAPAADGTVAATDSKNEGFRTRRLLIEDSREHELMIPVNSADKT
jgi:hypothetical protein